MFCSVSYIRFFRKRRAFCIGRDALFINGKFYHSKEQLGALLCICVFSHSATLSELLSPMIPVAMVFSSSSAFSIAYASSAIWNMEISFRESPNTTSFSQPYFCFKRRMALAFVAPFGKISSQYSPLYLSF